MTTTLTKHAEFLAGASGGNTGQNHYGTIGIIITIVGAIVILAVWFVARSRR